MLPIQKLRDAGIETSKNPLLQDLLQAVKRYNILPDPADRRSSPASAVVGQSKPGSHVRAAIAKFEELGKAKQNLPDGHFRLGRSPVDELGRAKQDLLDPKATALQDVMVKAGRYLTSKPPQRGKPENKKRWDAITAVAQAAGREADELGFKLVDGPSDFRSTSQHNMNVWLEVIDPLHRNQGALSDAYQKWLNDPEACRKKLSFWGYDNAALKVPGYTEVGDDYLDLPGQVKYDTIFASLVEFRGQHAIDADGEALDTFGAESIHSGRGWGIYVCDTKRRFFVGAHDSDDAAGWVRHTTLAAGAPVLSAGEIVVQRGRVLAISNETGHYRLPFRLFLRFICECLTIPGEAIARVILSDGSIGYVTCNEIRRYRGDFDSLLKAQMWKEQDWARQKLPQVFWP